MKTSFAQLLEDNKRLILKICRAYALDEDETKDLFQEVSINIWKALPGFGHKSAISTWIYRISLNTCMRQKLKNDKSAQYKVDFESIRISHQSTENEPTEGETRLNKLYTCIHQLDEADKAIVLLYLEEMPYKQIAEICGLSENHVAVKMKRIKKKLFDCLNL